MTQIETNNEIEDKKSLNFIEQIVEADLKAGKNGGRLNTRFPPEPNGYLHIGHAKAICMDFGIAEKFGGTCNLRFDDTNPVKEDVEYVDSIMEDIHWLGFDWGDRLYYASDYFPKLWDLAIRLIKEGKAYVDEQSSEEIARQKGTPTQPGIESPYRNRSVEENLDLFERMNKGEFEEGRFVLRAKIDMASPNMHFRDPIMYRIIKHPHHRTGTKWNVYPMYDFAHGQSDYFEGVTHSICTLEFEVHRPLYEYFVIGYTKYDGIISVSLLEHSIREDLNKTATRVSAVLNPVKLIITNYPENKVEYLETENNPEDPEAGTHQIPFTRVLYIERDDFMENPPKKFFRLAPDQEVRLKSAYIIKCTGIKKDSDGNVEEIYCEYDPDTRSGMPGSMRKVKGTLHWVSAEYSSTAEVRLYDRLFNVENPAEEKDVDFRELLNPDSLKIVDNCRIEPYLAENAKPGNRYQFQRTGYFCVDPDSTDGHLVFNRTVSLKDSWEKLKSK